MTAAMGEPIYLDYNATTPPAPEVLEAMLPVLRDGWGNPSSAHAYGRRARQAVERAAAGEIRDAKSVCALLRAARARERA